MQRPLPVPLHSAGGDGEDVFGDGQHITQPCQPGQWLGYGMDRMEVDN